MNERNLTAMLPEWARSARFRLALLYSIALFCLATLAVAGLYLAVNRSIRSAPVSETYIVNERVLVTEIDEFERAVNEHTLGVMRDLSAAGLGLLFLGSLWIGWVIAGRVLSPIDRIADVANEIEATDLSRRIELQGPDDELKKLADTFDRMLGRLDEAFSMQRKFIADASHELRNPLAIIRTNVDLLLEDPNTTPEKIKHTGEVVRRATDRMARLVDDLLALARLEAPGFQWETVDVSALVAEVADESDASAQSVGVAIVVDSATTAPAEGDRDSLKRALANLIDNAMRHAPRGSTIRLRAGTDNGQTWFSVEDEGPGIPVDQQEHVFERFFRTDASRSRASGGSGLGLAIVRQIAEAHDGSATVDSRPGAGATFTIKLPLRREGVLAEA